MTCRRQAARRSAQRGKRDAPLQDSYQLILHAHRFLRNAPGSKRRAVSVAAQNDPVKATKKATAETFARAPMRSRGKISTVAFKLGLPLLRGTKYPPSPIFNDKQAYVKHFNAVPRKKVKGFPGPIWQGRGRDRSGLPRCRFSG
jgi:hypothetical protein